MAQTVLGTGAQRALVAVVALLLLTGYAPAPSVAAPVKTRVHVIDRSTVFTATETSRTRIRFESPVTWDQIPHVHVHGQGRLYGFILRKVGDFEQEAYRPYYKWLGSAACDERACRAPLEEHPGVMMSVHGSEISKFSGTWDAYVIADGARVSVDFEIAGSRGRDEIRVTGPVASELTTFAPSVQEVAGHTVYTGGGFTTLEDTDFAQGATWVSGKPYVASAAGICSYMTEEEARVQAVALPQCPGGAEMFRQPMYDAGSGEYRAPFYSGSFVEGDRGLGIWHVAAAAVEEFGAVGLWIDYPEI
jgi:hypothetical protein